jgi:hypothetical protein
MNDKLQMEIPESSNEEGDEFKLSRRQAMQGAAVVAVAGGALLGGTREALAVWPNTENPTPRFETILPHEGGMFTYTVGYTDEDVHWWPGRTVGGALLGVVQLSANIPMIPGNVGNASTFDFDLIYQKMEVSGDMVVSSDPHPEVLRLAIEACNQLEAAGCRAVIGNCGFFGNYQQLVAEQVRIPFFSSSLVQLPPLLATLSPRQKCLVITADGPILENAPALENCGVTSRDRLVIRGLQEGPEMQRVLTVSGSYNPKRLEGEIVDTAKKAIEEFPEIGMIMLECTELSPHAWKVQEETGRPVWDFTTMTNWIHAGLVRAPFGGWM